MEIINKKELSEQDFIQLFDGAKYFYKYTNVNGIEFYLASDSNYSINNKSYKTEYYIRFYGAYHYYCSMNKRQIEFVFGVTQFYMEQYNISDNLLNEFLLNYGIDEFRKFINTINTYDEFELVTILKSDTGIKPVFINGVLEYPNMTVDDERLSRLSEKQICDLLLANNGRRPINDLDIDKRLFVPDYIIRNTKTILLSTKYISSEYGNLTEDGITKFRYITNESTMSIKFTQKLNNKSKYDIFIIHSDADKDLANEIEKEIQLIFGNKLKFFNASNAVGIKAGHDWFNVIIAAHRSSKMGLALMSENTIDNKWVHFEIGGFFLRQESSIIPVFLDQNALSKLKFPISGIQGKKIWEPQHRKAMIDQITEVTGIDSVNYNDDNFKHFLNRLKSFRVDSKITNKVIGVDTQDLLHTEPVPNSKFDDYYNDDDIKNILSEWIQKHIPPTGVIDFNTVDSFLNLSSGTTKKFIKEILPNYNLEVDREGKTTIKVKASSNKKRSNRLSDGYSRVFTGHT